MKVVKGSKWLKRDFMEQLEQLFEDNHVVELDSLVKFEGKERFIKNMLIREEFAQATNDDIVQQVEVERIESVRASKDAVHQDKLKEEEAALRAAMGI